MTAIDYLGPHGGELALAFAAGCVATWVFMKIIYDQRVIDYDKRIVEIKEAMAIQREQCDRDRIDSAKSEALLWDRISQLQAILMSTGNAKMQAELQRVIPLESDQ